MTFVGLAKVETMLRDFAEHRRLIHTHAPIEKIEQHWDRKCERWTYCINPNQEESYEGRSIRANRVTSNNG